jgi:transposase
MTTNVPDGREQRGLAIAEKFRLTKKGGVWLVPSQSADRKTYTVCPDPKSPHCTCADHEERGCKCKHIWAVEIVIQRQLFDDGTVTETKTVTVSEKRTTYPQNWPAYNAAQTGEKHKFQILLRDLVRGIPQPELPRRRGNQPFPIRDAIFAACFKVYSTVSGRRFMTDMREAHEKGYVGKCPCYNMIFKVLESPETFGILQSLVVEAASPLKAVEVNFAVDSSGFSASKFDRWYDHKFGDHRIKRAWVKAHIMCGVKTNAVTAVEIHDQHAGDSPQLKPLLATTGERFKMLEVSADMAYLSRSNLHAVMRTGAMPFIPFKSNSVATGSRLWEHLWHYFHLHREQFLSRYHQRSNVESTFSMIKRKFGDSVRSKTDVAMRNEVLAKLVCHNIVCVIHEMHEQGIEPAFWNAA